MKVYVVLEYRPYEGGEIVGVFSTKDQALNYVKVHDPYWDKPHPKNLWLDIDEWHVSASPV